ncbi:MAG: outer membrane protein assembly factor BamC [Chromatocurvus sp.]
MSLRFLSVGCLAIMLGGCGYLFGDAGYFRDRSGDYRDARATEVIQAPSDEAPALQEMYPIPPIQNSALLSNEFEVPRPAPLASGRAEELVRIQRLGDESWALVAVAPGQLWPQVRAFLSAAGINPGRTDAGQGTIETDWLQLRDQDMQSRFRFRIERGVQRGTSELHVLQMNRAGDTGAWPETSDNLEHESEMLRSVAQYVANSSETAPVSMMADQAISAGGRISVQENASGEPYIGLGLPFNRGWASLALALDAANFDIADRDRSAGRYYVRFIGDEEEDDGGWFGWLFGGGDGHPLADRRYVVSVTEDSANAVQIELEPDAGESALEPAQKKALLERIKGNIN